MSASSPFSTTTTIHEVTIVEVIRGPRADELLQETFSFNPKPSPGREYMLALVRLRYLQGPEGETDWVHQVDFRLLSGQGVRYDYPFGVFPIEPFLSARLYPGSLFVGWTTWEVAIDDKSPLMVWGLDLFSRSTGFFFQTDILIRLVKQGYLFAEVPYRLKTRGQGQSKAVSFPSLMAVIRGYMKLSRDLYYLKKRKVDLDLAKDSVSAQRHQN